MSKSAIKINWYPEICDPEPHNLTEFWGHLKNGVIATIFVSELLHCLAWRAGIVIVQSTLNGKLSKDLTFSTDTEKLKIMSLGSPGLDLDLWQLWLKVSIWLFTILIRNPYFANLFSVDWHISSSIVANLTLIAFGKIFKSGKLYNFLTQNCKYTMSCLFQSKMFLLVPNRCRRTIRHQ